MYMPPQFAEVRVDELHRIIQENSLGILVRRTSGGLEADHLPFLIGTDGDHGSLSRTWHGQTRSGAKFETETRS